MKKLIAVLIASVALISGAFADGMNDSYFSFGVSTPVFSANAKNGFMGIDADMRFYALFNNFIGIGLNLGIGVDAIEDVNGNLGTNFTRYIGNAAFSIPMRVFDNDDFQVFVSPLISYLSTFKLQKTGSEYYYLGAGVEVSVNYKFSELLYLNGALEYCYYGASGTLDSGNFNIVSCFVISPKVGITLYVGE